MSLKLVRPMVFFDLETTGINVLNDRIVEMSFVKLFPDGKKEEKTKRVNPTIPIPKEAIAVHGITDDDVKDEPTFAMYAKSLAAWLKGCDLAGFNSNHFDVPLLVEEFNRAKVDFSLDDVNLIDVFNIYRKKEKRNLEAAYRFYCNKELKDAHSASADVNATLDVLIAQVDKYEDLADSTAKSLAEYSSSGSIDLMGRIVRNDNGVPVFNFGKYKNQPVAEVFEKDTSYYSWMMNGEFEASTKDVITKIKLGILK